MITHYSFKIALRFIAIAISIIENNNGVIK